MNKKKAIKLIKERIKEVELLKNTSRYEKEYHFWKYKTENTLKNIFGKDSEYLKKFGNIWTPKGVGTNNIDFQKIYIESLDEAEAMLQALVDGIENDEIGKFEAKQNIQKDKKMYPNEVQIAIIAILIMFYLALPTILPKEIGGFTLTLPRIASYSLAVLWFVTVIIGAFASDTLLASPKIKNLYQLWFSICNTATLFWFILLLAAYLSYLLL
jgi:hypothetical protein|uniref:Uncharacterized protein n=1 Tax=Dictyoglomus turgidum TaxID=513050 RepID=A0A7C3WNS6_9BACT